MTELTAGPALPVPILPEPRLQEDLWPRLRALVHGRRVAVLTGAGISTESGIPDYRGAGTRKRARAPIPFREFIASAEGRQRYWARAMLGWARMDAARPNAGHLAVKELESVCELVGLITQNVDRLHHKAGSEDVVELHGSLFEVKCLECGFREPRNDLQERLRALTPGFENQTLLVIGSSLEVYSGFCVARAAARADRNLAVINLGPTRADDICTLKIEARAGRALKRLIDVRRA